MASIYFYYNELLRQSADRAAVKNGQGSTWSSSNNCIGLQQQAGVDIEASTKKQQGHSSEPPGSKATSNENQDEDAAPHEPCQLYADVEAALAVLQPRLNQLAYLPMAGVTTTLARALGPQP